MRKAEVDAGFKVLLGHGQKVTCTGPQSEKAAETGKMMWIRHCPRCNNKLCKVTLQYPIVCAWCGWVWQ
jgi:hypothetical protein